MRYASFMKRVRITTGGQISIPADIRRRWGTSTVVIDDGGDQLVVRPVPDDPIAAVRGSLAGLGIDTEAMRRQARRDDEDAVARRSK